MKYTVIYQNGSFFNLILGEWTEKHQQNLDSLNDNSLNNSVFERKTFHWEGSLYDLFNFLQKKS